MKTRTRICFLILLLAPMVIYWQTAFSNYGMRDDYSSAREARDEAGTIVRFTASHGRPLFGALLETSLAHIDEIEHLWILRLATVILLTVLGIALWRQLYHSGWTEIEAAVIGLGVTLLPGSQVLASWASIWPHTMALLLSMAGFAAVETELERGGLKRMIAMLGGVMIYAVAALIYQSNALFAVVPMAAVLLVRTERGSSSDLKWAAIHLSTLLTGLTTAYLITKALFTHGIFSASARMQFETDPLGKIFWFFSNPLANAMGLYALRDDFNAGAVVFWITVAIVLSLIAWGCRVEIKRVGVAAKRRVLVCIIVFPLLAHAVSLMAAERAVGYRTLFGLSGLVLVLVVFALRSLILAEKIKAFYYYAGLIGLTAAALVTAHFNPYLLIAVPQNYEWETIRTVAMRADFPKTQRVYIVTPTLSDRATTRVFSDEFGAVTGDSDWVAKEMFQAALHDRFPLGLPKGSKYEVVLGREMPDRAAYDLVIDMKNFRERAER